MVALSSNPKIHRSFAAELKRLARRFLEKTAIGHRALESYGLYRRNRLAIRHGGAKAFFTYVYETNFWDNPESVSGHDSTIAYTADLRRELGQLLLRHRVKRILDAPCGDFNWFRLIELPPGSTYIGGDVVEALIARNTAQYGNESRSFQVTDICRDRLPQSDLWICRNTLFHLSYVDIYAALRNGIEAGIEYFLVTTHPRSGKNVDIPSGSYRLLDLESVPFLFPEPLVRIDDYAEGEEFRQMCLWRREQVAAVVNAG